MGRAPTMARMVCPSSILQRVQKASTSPPTRWACAICRTLQKRRPESQREVPLLCKTTGVQSIPEGPEVTEPAILQQGEPARRAYDLRVRPTEARIDAHALMHNLRE